MERLILASASPRRRELLANAGFSFTVMSADTDETIPEGTSPEEAVKLLAKRKADTVKERCPGSVIVAADTIVYCAGEILGKPHDQDDAFRMLSLLSGNTHQVYTGVCILRPDMPDTVFAECSDVTFYPLSKEEILQYISTGEPMDKAGAYGIQGKGCILVRSIRGDYFNIVGLPVARVARELQK